MKTNLLLITASSVASLFLTGTAFGQTPPASKMKAIVYYNYGPPEVLQLEEIEKPVPTDNQVLVKVRAVSVNPYDWHFMEGIPYIARLLAFGPLKPKSPRLGVDFSGTVEAVGKNVTAVQTGRRSLRRERSGPSPSMWSSPRNTWLRSRPTSRSSRPDRFRLPALTALQGLARQGKGSAGPKGPDQRRVGRRGHVRRANRQASRGACDRRLQREERGAGPIARRRPRHRLHERRFHQERAALRRDYR